MADAPILINKQTTPKGVVPRNLQTWAMIALAVAILAVMVFGTSEPPQDTAAIEAARRQLSMSSTGNGQMRDFNREMSAIANRSMPAEQPTGQRDPQEIVEQRSTSSPPPADPIKEAQKRKEYDSLFSSNVIASKRNAVSGGSNARAAAPTLDDAAAAVVRAQAGLQPREQTTPQPAPLPPEPAPAGAAPERVRTPALTNEGPMYRLLEGTVIDGTLILRLDGSSASPVKVLVSGPVYSHDRSKLLIPKGAIVLGETKPVQAFGETRLAVGFHQLQLPDGQTVSLDQDKGLDQAGDNGVHDLVNRHYWSMFGAAAAMGVISGLGQYVSNLGYSGDGDNNTVVVSGMANSMTQATAQVMSRFLNRMPTVTIREGHRIKIYLTKTLDMPAWKG